MAALEPYTLRDFRQGRYIPASVSNALVPENSVAHAVNVNFDTIVGQAVVRPGTTLLGANVVATPSAAQGLGVFVKNNGVSGFTTYVVAAFQTSGSANSTNAYYYDGSWHTTTTLTSWGNFPMRFDTLGNKMFMTSLSAGMYSSSDANTWANGAANNCIASADAKPNVIKRYAGRLLCAGDYTYRSRVYFSSIIAPSSAPFITWNSDNSTGDWIDVNPDDGGYVTGFSETSTFCLVFKSTGMYRMDTVAKTTEPENIYNVGAVSQEAIVLCQGITYYFSGIDIRRTNGGFPEQISRAGVQDIIDAISQSNWSAVAAGTDGLSVWWSVGTVTLNSGSDRQVTITNCVIKFSPRDQNWSVHGYANGFKFFTTYTDSTNGQKMIGSDSAGNVQKINVGTLDNATAINYLLESQDLEFGDRAHMKNISESLVVYSDNGMGGNVQIRFDGKDLKDVHMTLEKRVNIGRDVNVQGNFFNFVWYGVSKNKAPVLEGFHIPKITDNGINYG